jgi:hypothetical protein
MSPAVCGLIRPVILLPRSLVEQLPPAQLRSVLLHELIHLRRGDVWVNCAQALLQVVYWWHPLLWLANARIRRTREEAVDDAVMLALRDDAESYAPTLLEVAKLAFHRPLASLGLVGILESRNALRQRIERLVSFRPPRRAGLSVVATLGIVAFAALAVPMGERPINSVALNSVDEPARKTNNAPTVTSTSNLGAEPSSAGNASQRGAPAETFEKFFVEKRPIWENTPGPRYSYSGKVGLLLNVEVRADGSCWAGSNRLDLSQLSAVLPQVERTNSLLGVHVKADVKAPLQSVVMLFDRLQHLGVSSITLTTTGEGAILVQTRSFKLDVKTFLHNLKQKAGWADPIGTEDVSVALRMVLSDVGVSLQTLEFCFDSDRKDLLFFRATETDMEHIQKLLEELNYTPPQITLASRFIEMPEPVYRNLWAKLSHTNGSAAGAWTAILTQPQVRELVKGLEAKDGVDLLTAPSVTTLSGRQAQIQVVDLKSIATGLTNTVTNGATNFLYKTEKLPVGPALDVLPTVSADGHTIRMTVIPTVTDFLGYEDSETFTTNLVLGPSNQVVLPLPHFRVRQTTASIAVWDGQTVVIGNVLPVEIFTKPDGTQAATPATDKNLKRLIVLVTPTITDPAGNRVHSEEEMPFARDGVPAQPNR